MTTFRSDETLVGIISLGAVAWIVWILVRAARDARLPIGKSQILRGERPVAFGALFALYVAAALGMTFIGLDLLFGLTGRSG